MEIGKDVGTHEPCSLKCCLAAMTKLEELIWKSHEVQAFAQAMDSMVVSVHSLLLLSGAPSCPGADLT